MRYCRRFLAGIPHLWVDDPRVPHPSATLCLRRAFDLHVLGTPPAFILSQDQTRHSVFMSNPRRNSKCCFSELSPIDRYVMCYFMFLTTLQLFWYINASAFVASQISPERMRDDITASRLCQEVFTAIFLHFYKIIKIQSHLCKYG